MNQVVYNDLSPASIWIFKKYLELEQVLEQGLNDYELAHSIDALYKFLWDYYADWYVEYLKTDDSQLAFSKELFRQYVISLAPYSPFETEALWQEHFGEKTLLATEIKDRNWSKQVLQSLGNNLESATEFETVLDFVQNLRSLRGLFAIDPVNLMQIYTKNEILNKYIGFIKLVGRGEIVNESKPDLYNVKTANLDYSVDIFEYIKDVQAEISRTNKIVADLEKQIMGLESQLNNQKFIENAESEIIDEKKQNLADRKLELEQQKTKMEILNK